MYQQVCLAHLVKCRFEGFYQVVRQLTDEAHRITQEERQVVERYLANSGVQRGEEFILCKDLRLAQQVHQCGLAHVGVTYERHAHHLPAVLALGSHLLVYLLEVFSQQGNALSDDTLIRLYLRLTHTTAGGAAASLAVEVRPHTGQARQHILQMRHLHLRLSITRLGTLQEDFQDKYRSVHHADSPFLAALHRTIQCLLDVANLPRRQLIVEDDEPHLQAFLRRGLVEVFLDFLQLTFAHIGGGIGHIQSLYKTLDGHYFVCVRQECQLIQILFGAFFRLLRGD